MAAPRHVPFGVPKDAKLTRAIVVSAGQARVIRLQRNHARACMCMRNRELADAD